MEDYIFFEGRIEPVTMGKSTYTILSLPQDVSQALEAQGARRVEGEIGDHPVNLGISRISYVEGAFLWTGKSLLKAAGIEPGETLEVRLRKVDVDEVETPSDLELALRGAGKSDDWAALTAGKRRGMLYQIESAKRPDTRARRIAKLVLELE